MLPVLNMPKKKFQTVFIPWATLKMITKEIDNTTHQYYNSFKVVKVRIKKLKLLLDWIIDVSEDVVTWSENAELFTVPKFGIEIDDSLAYTIQIFDWLLPEDHELYKICKRSVKNMAISNLIDKLNNVNICLGIDTRELSGKLNYHVIHKTCNDQTEDEAFLINIFQSNVVVSWTDCIMLIDKCSTSCEKCNKFHCDNTSKTTKSKRITPARANAPLTNSSHDRVVLALKKKKIRM